MTSSNHYDDFILRDIKREIAHHERLHPKQQSQKPPAPEPTIHFLDQVPDKPLTWLWPGRIPFGHLTLLDAAPGSGLSLVALTLAACVSSGSPLPDGTPTQQGYVLLLAPYDSPTDILKPRLQAAGSVPDHVQLVRPLVQDPSLALARSRPYAFPQDLDHLAGSRMPAWSFSIRPAPSPVSPAACPLSLISPARPTVLSCSLAPCASPLSTPSTHLLPPHPCSRPHALACCWLPTQPATATSSCLRPNMPSAPNRSRWPTTFIPLKPASPPSTGWANATTASSHACAPVPSAPPIGKPSSASCSTATRPRASRTFLRPPATTAKPDAKCWYA